MDDDVKPPRIGDNLRDPGLCRSIRLNVEFDRAQIGLPLGRPGARGGDLRRVAPLGLTHRGVDSMAGLGQRARS
jgi:hypothetical protein